MGSLDEVSVMPVNFSLAMRRIRQEFIKVTPEEIAAASEITAAEIVELETNDELAVQAQLLRSYDLALQRIRPDLGSGLIIALATANKDALGPAGYGELDALLQREATGWYSTPAALLGAQIDTSALVAPSKCTLIAGAISLGIEPAIETVELFRAVARHHPGTILVGKTDLDLDPLFNAVPSWWRNSITRYDDGDAEIYFYGVPSPNGANRQRLSIDPVAHTDFDQSWICAIHMGASPAEGILVAWAVLAARIAARKYPPQSTISGWGVLDRGGIDVIAPILRQAEDPELKDPPAVPDPGAVLEAGRKFLTPWLRAYEAARRRPDIDETPDQPPTLQAEWRPNNQSLLVRRQRAYEQNREGPSPRSMIVFDDTALTPVPIAMGLDDLALWLRPNGFEVAWPFDGRPDTVEWMPSGAYRRILVRNDRNNWSAVQVLGS